MRLEIDLHGDVQVSRRLIRFADNVEDALPAFHTIADQLREGERRQFASEGAYGSGGWAANEPSTVQRKLASADPRIRANATAVMRATDETMRSLTGYGSGHVEIVQPHQLTFGTTVPQARHHQPDRKRRRVLEVPERGRRDMVRTLQKHLTGSLQGAAARGLT